MSSLGFICLQNNAQVDTSKQYIAKHHELWTNITPFVSTMLYCSDNNRFFDLMYKCSGIGKGMYRIGVGIELPEKNEMYYYNGVASDKYKVVSETDSMLTREVSAWNNSFVPVLNIGYEFRRGNKWKKYIGADITFSYKKRDYRIREEVYDKYGYTSQANASSYRLIEVNDLSSVSYKLYSPGINLFAGIGYSFSDHFVVSAQALCILEYSSGMAKKVDYTASKKSEYSVFSVESGFRPSLNLSYVF